LGVEQAVSGSDRSPGLQLVAMGRGWGNGSKDTQKKKGFRLLTKSLLYAVGARNPLEKRKRLRSRDLVIL